MDQPVVFWKYQQSLFNTIISCISGTSILCTHKFLKDKDSCIVALVHFFFFFLGYGHPQITPAGFDVLPFRLEPSFSDGVDYS